jgi:hypothetical protein
MLFDYGRSDAGMWIAVSATQSQARPGRLTFHVMSSVAPFSSIAELKVPTGVQPYFWR